MKIGCCCVLGIGDRKIVNSFKICLFAGEGGGGACKGGDRHQGEFSTRLNRLLKDADFQLQGERHGEMVQRQVWIRIHQQERHQGRCLRSPGIDKMW